MELPMTEEETERGLASALEAEHIGENGNGKWERRLIDALSHFPFKSAAVRALDAVLNRLPRSREKLRLLQAALDLCQRCLDQDQIKNTQRSFFLAGQKLSIELALSDAGILNGPVRTLAGHPIPLIGYLYENFDPMDINQFQHLPRKDFNDLIQAIADAAGLQLEQVHLQLLDGWLQSTRITAESDVELRRLVNLLRHRANMQLSAYRLLAAADAASPSSPQFTSILPLEALLLLCSPKQLPEVLPDVTIDTILQRISGIRYAQLLREAGLVESELVAVLGSPWAWKGFISASAALPVVLASPAPDIAKRPVLLTLKEAYPDLGI